MNKKAAITNKGKYILVSLEGPAFVAAEISKTSSKALELCRKTGVKKLIIHRVNVAKQVATSVDYFDFSKALQEENLYDYKIALVYPPPLDERLAFFETAAQNRGVNLKVFTEINLAESWLNS